jgi:hypothetical protein
VIEQAALKAAGSMQTHESKPKWQARWMLFGVDNLEITLVKSFGGVV